MLKRTELDAKLSQVIESNCKEKFKKKRYEIVLYIERWLFLTSANYM